MTDRQSGEILASAGYSNASSSSRIEHVAVEASSHMLYKLAIFASALLAGARAEVRPPPPGVLGARGV